MRSIGESDWKKLRAIRPCALERLCTETLDGLRLQLEPRQAKETAHETFLAVFEYLGRRNATTADLFDDWRRSTALLALGRWLEAGVVSREEFETLSEETRALMGAIAEPRFFEER
jgi:hypothetical protein